MALSTRRAALPPAARNPFEFGRELSPDELVNRAAELDQLLRTIENADKLFLIGPRRYGKTSLLHAAQARAESRGIVVLRYDAERYESLDLLAEALLTGAARALAGPIDRAGDLLARVAAKLKPHVTYDVSNQQLSLSLGIERTAASELPILADALDTVEKLASHAKRPAAVILDEFQHVVEARGATAERQIRAVVQRHRHVGYIFAGSATRLLADMTSDAGRAFYKMGARLFIGPLPAEEFKAFLHGGFAQSKLKSTPEGVDAILELAEEVPYSVQRLAHACWEMLRVEPARQLDREAVTGALRQVLMQENPAYTQLWNSLTQVQKRAAKAVVLERGLSLQSAEVSRRYRIPTASMQKALGALDRRGVIREEALVGRVRWRLEDPLFGAWLRMAQEL